ncbi:MAG: RIP metalloprotease RseP [Balneolales bacterium]|nr:RIP metalloprotease RseP [Balneolales bacterium]
MEFLTGLPVTILLFIAAIFVLVLVHEFGHYIAAKLFGMRVEQFSIGFPPRLFGKKIGDTDYCISATPLGGYVKIAGMADETTVNQSGEMFSSEPKEYEFRAKPVWQRLIVMVAGVVFNILLAIVIFGMLQFVYGKIAYPADKVGELYISETSLAYEIGMRTGDELIEINGRRYEVYESMSLVPLSELTRSNFMLTVLRDGEMVQIQAPSNFLDLLNRNPEFLDLTNALPSTVGTVAPGSPAERAGVQSGDKIIEIDGKSISFFSQISEIVRASEGELSILIDRDGEILSKMITPNPDTRIIGVSIVNPAEHFDVVHLRQGFFASLGGGAVETWDTTTSMLSAFGMMLRGNISVRDNLGGPVAIASVTRDATSAGGSRGFWYLVAFLSISLAIVNMLPIPVLDGGHVVFLLYEAVTRREPSVKVRMALQQVGLLLIIGLFIFVTFNDIMRHIVN